MLDPNAKLERQLQCNTVYCDWCVDQKGKTENTGNKKETQGVASLYAGASQVGEIK